MVQSTDSPITHDKIPPDSPKPGSVEAITQYKIDERMRWKKRIISFVFLGLLISVLVHLNIGFLLSFLMRGGSDSGSSGALTTIEFAIQDSESLSDMPEGEQLQQQESVQTEASPDSLNATQATLTADASITSLTATSQAMTPSLAGGGGGGMGSGMGGSGGGTSFFGISSAGSRFCYIVDISGSMLNQNRLALALSELTKSLKKLPDFAKFYVLFYSNQVKEPAIQKGWNTARSSVVRRMIKEFETLRAGGGTMPKPAFEKVFSLQPLPEVIFFLTDGEISGFSADTLRTMIPRGKRIVVNTIAFGDSANQQQMIDIAKATGGQYKFVKSGRKP